LPEGFVRHSVRKNCREQFLTSAPFADDPKGVGQEARSNPSRRAIYSNKTDRYGSIQLFICN